MGSEPVERRSRTETESSIPETKPKGKDVFPVVNEQIVSDRLGQIVAAKEIEVARLASRASTLRAQAEAMGPPRGFAQALRDPAEVRLLAEIKWRSPSAGTIREAGDP